MPDSELARIFEHYGTDKVGYAPVYEAFLRQRRKQVSKIIEVGIGTLMPEAHSSMVGWGAAHYRPGGSLRSWRDYFPNATIIGIDVQSDTQFNEERIKTFICDSTDSVQVTRLDREIGLGDADMIVDDGSHRADDQIATLRNLFRFLAPGGVYTIEDVVGNGLFARIQEILEVVGQAPMFCAGAELNPIFIRAADSKIGRLESPTYPYQFDDKGLAIRRFRPLIFTALYGDDWYFNCLHLMLQSLIDFGRYDGDIAILTDRPTRDVFPYLPGPLVQRTKVIPLADRSLIGRYSISDHELAKYSPVLYLDVDIIVNREILPCLEAIAGEGGICVTTESEHFAGWASRTAAQMDGDDELVNWFGLPLLRADDDCRNKLFPCANSGIIGFRDQGQFGLISHIVRGLYRHPVHADLARRFTDQPFFNYALVKTGLGRYETLRTACRFLEPRKVYEPDRERFFAHFDRVVGHEKLDCMQRYVSALRWGSAPLGVTGTSPVLREARSAGHSSGAPAEQAPDRAGAVATTEPDGSVLLALSARLGTMLAELRAIGDRLGLRLSDEDDEPEKAEHWAALQQRLTALFAQPVAEAASRFVMPYEEITPGIYFGFEAGDRLRLRVVPKASADISPEDCRNTLALSFSGGWMSVEIALGQAELASSKRYQFELAARSSRAVGCSLILRRSRAGATNDLPLADFRIDVDEFSYNLSGQIATDQSPSSGGADTAFIIILGSDGDLDLALEYLNLYFA
jgi:hypothetical protein